MHKIHNKREELTIERISRYMTELGEFVHDEGLKMKLFPSSLTMNAFTWF